MRQRERERERETETERDRDRAMHFLPDEYIINTTLNYI